jgi:hypothetical protein
MASRRMLRPSRPCRAVASRTGCLVPSRTSPVRGEDAQQAIDRQGQLIDRLAHWITARGLAAPAVLFLEASKPLAPIGSQVLLLFQPMLGAIGPTLGWFDDDQIVAEYAELLEDTANVDRVLEALEREAGIE